MSDSNYRRIIYTSRPTSDARDEVGPILRVSRANNALDGLSGLLWATRQRYLQLLEGPPDSVATTFDRIRADDRHADVQVISDTVAEERLFADWSMAGMPGERPADAMDRLELLLVDKPAHIIAMFKEERSG